MTTDRVDDALNELKAALNVEPSAELASGVRRHVSRAAVPRAGLFRPRVLALAAMVTAIVGSVLMWPRTAEDARGSVIRTVPSAPSLASIGVPAAPTQSAPVVAPVPVSRRDSDVLIPPGEIAAMRALVGAIERAEFEVPPETAIELDGDGRVKLLEIPLVVIEPVNTPKIGEEKGIGS